MTTIHLAEPSAETLAGGRFEAATRSVLAFLRNELDLDMALLSRRVDSHYVVLVADDERWNLRDGDVLAWEDTFCARVVDGRAPMIAPSVDDVPAFVEARAISGSDIASYAGVPIKDGTGEETVVLCGGSAQVKTAEFTDRLPVMHLLAELLGTMLRQEDELAVSARSLERAQLHANTDALTGLANRRHWNTMLTLEAERFRRYASPYTVIAVDLDGLKAVNDGQGHAAGDELLILTGEVLTALIRPSDTAARLGGDEFGILAVECGQAGASALTSRLRDAFDAAGIPASVGMAVASPGVDARATWAGADQAMYQAKRDATMVRALQHQ